MIANLMAQGYKGIFPSPTLAHCSGIDAETFSQQQGLFGVSNMLPFMFLWFDKRPLVRALLEGLYPSHHMSYLAG